MSCSPVMTSTETGFWWSWRKACSWLCMSPFAKVHRWGWRFPCRGWEGLGFSLSANWQCFCKSLLPQCCPWFWDNCIGSPCPWEVRASNICAIICPSSIFLKKVYLFLVSKHLILPSWRLYPIGRSSLFQWISYRLRINQIFKPFNCCGGYWLALDTWTITTLFIFP